MLDGRTGQLLAVEGAWDSAQRDAGGWRMSSEGGVAITTTHMCVPPS